MTPATQAGGERALYSAVSLQHIAEQFRRNSAGHADAMTRATTEKVRRDHSMAADTWKRAAEFLDLCELTPALAVVS